MTDILCIATFALIVITLGALAWRDHKEFILPDVLNLALLLEFIAFHTLTDWQVITPIYALVGAVSASGMLLGIRFIANKIYKQDALGLGDVKLMFAAGYGVGYPNVFLVLSLGAFIGMLHGIVISKIKSKQEGKKRSIAQERVPAGVGLTIGILIIVVWQFQNIF